MKKTLNIATVFSGIGAFEQALKKLKINFNIIFACDNGEIVLNQSINQIKKDIKHRKLDDDQINCYIKDLYKKIGKTNWMKKSYFANYKICESNWFDDIRFINGNKFKDKVDIFVGGSPCQSFSIIGKKGGLEDARGTLFYEYARLVKEIQPKVFIYENVPGMLVHDKGNTWKVIRNIFDSLGYTYYAKILNAKDNGIPQDRKRLFVVGFKNKNASFDFPDSIKLSKTMFDFLEDKIDAKYYLGKKGFNFVTNKKYKNRARVNRKIIQTQKANQQFNWNGDFVFEKLNSKKHTSDILKRAYVGTFNNEKGVIRQLTNRECFRLMGFPDSFKIVVPPVWAYRQSGNSIVVNVLERLVKKILEAEQFSDKLQLATVFSGIGSVEFALKRLGIKYNVVFACDNGEREIAYDEKKEKKKVFSLATPLEKKNYVDRLYSLKTHSKNYVQETYLTNYPECNKENYFQDVKLLDGKDYFGKVDLFVGGSPCQSFSSVGKQFGLEDARGTLFYEYARLVKEIQPKVFIYENVRNLINHDHGNTWNKIRLIFKSLGYKLKFSIMNAADYGIPQNRRRLFVIGYKTDVTFDMPPKFKKCLYSMKDFLLNNCAQGNFVRTKNGKIKIIQSHSKVSKVYTLSPKVYAYVMKGGTKSFYQKPEINMKIARTILKTMGNRHRAGVDNYVSQNGSTKLGDVRMLTEREAHRLMGYTDDFKIVVSRAQAYKQAGNSIVVDVLIAIIDELIKKEVLRW